MEANSEGENDANMEHTPTDGSKRPKRQMKTPYQLEVLESTYATDMYPSEATRLELSERLGLTDRQLQMWFCHRRLKDKKDMNGGGSSKPEAVGSVGKRGLAEPLKEEMMVARSGTGHGSGSSYSSGSDTGAGSGASQFDGGDDTPLLPARYHESNKTIMEHRAIACIEAQLGEPLREDGPILGIEFDDVPPGAFGAPIAHAAEEDRYRRSYDDKYGQYEAQHIKVVSSGHCGESKARHASYGHGAPSYMNYGAEGQMSSLDVMAQMGRPVHSSLSPRNIARDEDNLYLERKRKGEALIGRDAQSHGKRTRKEIEKQELLRKKIEDQMRKETERLDRERRKEEQRMIREQQRLEEKYQREERREMERREKFMEKERLRLERRKQKDENRKEKEALRQKAAMERATARKIAKESMELIEDERLELMELAASNKGLPSIASLDHDTLQNLELFRESLCEFPPKSVQLRKPFAIQPWINSEENVGNLLMVWKFCVTFSDILEVGTFALDEFIQAFHDLDSRLLAEVHISLLKLIIKDIEDVVRTPSGGPGTNQYTAVNPEGGHPHIVEGAYLWGFDIRNWQKNINPLTWPEILRQFALSAGFGPQVKKKGVDGAGADDSNELKGSEDIVSTLRNGSAAEHAVALMNEKGLTLQRKSRHRLTPGTVKFAAYHVLALEGGKGLNVLDIADKIQKSGLRDLTTSKTPEASISVALSRDPILFERTAPSTYCVRPAFRKDPADAESIIAEAKEKIQKYTDGFLAGQNADEEDRDDDSDGGDVAEGVEIDALANTPSEANKSIECDDACSVPGNVKDKILDSGALDSCANPVEDIGQVNVDQGFEVEGNKLGEPWVQGLTEGEYSDLTVEERLDALVALVGVANEGNTIRAILEDRQDAANALKKQMWAEAQLDKRRMREEIPPKVYDSSFNTVTEGIGSISPIVIAENKSNQLDEKREPSVAEDVRNSIDNPPQDTDLGQFNSGFTTERSRLMLKSYIGHKAEEMHVYRSLPLGQDRRRNRYWHFIASDTAVDSGCGRIFVETPSGCLKLIDSEKAFDALVLSLDIRGTRESHLHNMLQKIEFRFKAGVQRNRFFGDIYCRNVGVEEICEGVPDLDCTNGDSPNSIVCSAGSDRLEPSHSFRIEIGQNEKSRRKLLKRYNDLLFWTWEECHDPPILRGMAYGVKRCLPLLGICDSCLDTYETDEETCSCGLSNGEGGYVEKFSDEFMSVDTFIDTTGTNLKNKTPVRVRLIRSLLNLLEVYVPSEAFHSSWTDEHRGMWGKKLQKSSSIGELLELLTIFEGSIRREYLSASFETNEELLCHYTSSKHAEVHLPWIPITSAAVALRLLDLDGCIAYTPDMKVEHHDEKNVKALQKLTSRNGCNTKEQHKLEFDRYGSMKVEKRNITPLSSGSKQVLRGRGGGRPRGKSQKASSSNSGKRGTKQGNSLAEVLKQQGTIAQGQIHGRGPRTLRKRRMEDTKSVSNNNAQGTSKNVVERSVSVNDLEFVNMENTNTMAGKDDDDANSPSIDESDDNGDENLYGFEKWGSSSYAAAADTNAREMSEDEEAGFEPSMQQHINDESDNESSDSMVSGDYSSDD